MKAQQVLSKRFIKDKIRTHIRQISRGNTISDGIDIIDTIDYESFKRDYADLCKPVIIKKMADTWLLTIDGLAKFEELCGTQKIKVRVGNYSTGKGEIKMIPTTVNEYLSMVRKLDGQRGELPPYAGYQVPSKEIKEYLHYPDWLDTTDIDEPIHYWLGPKGAYTGIHSDTCDKLVYQCEGEKKWCLIAPHFSDKLYLWDDFGKGYDASPIHPEKPDYKKHPKFSDVDVNFVTLEPGDIMYLPGGWYHTVKSLGLTLAFEFKSKAVPISINDPKMSDEFVKELVSAGV
jgi:hypothetical protein